MQHTLKALIWDVDGTLAETERDGHRVAFNQAFEQHGLPWRWDEAHYGQLLRITGGRERLLHDMAQHRQAEVAPAEREALARELHPIKNHRYGLLVRAGRLQPRPGVLALIEQARAQGLRQAIATTTSRSNVEALLGGMFGRHWQSYFDAVVCGEDVARKKPDPEAYVRALAQLGLQPHEAIAIEDAEPGWLAARSAGLRVLLTPSIYFPDPPAAAHRCAQTWCCADLSRVSLRALQQFGAAAAPASAA